MDLICCFRPYQYYREISVLSALNISKISSFNRFRSPPCLRFSSPATPSLRARKISFEVQAKKNKKKTIAIEPKRSKVEEESLSEEEDDVEEEEQVLLEDVIDSTEILTEDEEESFDFYLEDDEFDEIEEKEELYAGDGSGGGGIKLSGTTWDKEALALAEKVCESFDGELGLYAFKTLPNSTIQVRIERLTNKSGSPTMEDIEAYSKIYRAKLAEAEIAKSIPNNISLEVSSPGVERVVRIPQDLERYKERSMYVRYIVEEEGETEGDGIFKLVSFDVEGKSCAWGVADIRVNREKAGKGRPLSKKQREWRLQTPFESLRLVRLHSEC